jgi:DNA adenine methylase
MAENHTPSAAPILKWVGGKRKQVPALLQALELDKAPADANFWGDFLGGAALELEVAAGVLDGRWPGLRLILGDINKRLIDCYWETVHHTPEVLVALEALEELYRKAGDGQREDLAHHARGEVYYRARNRFNLGNLPAPEQAAHLLFLNRRGFNGLYRVNKSGGFNVPHGKMAGGYKPPGDDGARLRAFAATLGPVALLRTGHWRTGAWRRAKAGDRVYWDPPYMPDRKGGFVSYAGAFGEGEQRALARVGGALANRGVRVVHNNHDLPMVREMWEEQGFECVSFEAPRPVSRGRKGKDGTVKRPKARELLIFGGPVEV